MYGGGDSVQSLQSVRSEAPGGTVPNSFSHVSGAFPTPTSPGHEAPAVPCPNDDEGFEVIHHRDRGADVVSYTVPGHSDSTALLDFGKTSVHCGSSVVIGPDRGLFACTSTLIVIPTALFCVFVAQNVVVILFGVLLACLALGSLLKAGMTDPGIIPKQPAPPTLPTELEMIVEGAKLKWCTTCHIWRPERASHCNDCGNCVRKFDHHCPWTGTCIGERNYRYFIAFLTFLPMLCAYVVVASIFAVINVKSSEKDVCLQSLSIPKTHRLQDDFVSKLFSGEGRAGYGAPALLIFSLLIMLCVGCLCFYHVSCMLLPGNTHHPLLYSDCAEQDDTRGDEDVQGVAQDTLRQGLLQEHMRGAVPRPAQQGLPRVQKRSPVPHLVPGVIVAAPCNRVQCAVQWSPPPHRSLSVALSSTVTMVAQCDHLSGRCVWETCSDVFPVSCEVLALRCQPPDHLHQNAEHVAEDKCKLSKKDPNILYG